MADCKARGHDQLTQAHFKKLDLANKEIFCSVMNQWLLHRRVDSSLKQSIRICIPKGKLDTREVKNQRPISLTPIASRLFSHILVKRPSAHYCAQHRLVFYQDAHVRTTPLLCGASWKPASPQRLTSRCSERFSISRKRMTVWSTGQSESQWSVWPCRLKS